MIIEHSLTFGFCATGMFPPCPCGCCATCPCGRWSRCPCGGDCPLCCCVGYQWQSQKWSLNIYIWRHCVTMRCCTSLSLWRQSLMLWWISVIKSKINIDHLLTPFRTCPRTAPLACGDGPLCCIGYQWQSQKWSLNIYSLLVRVVATPDDSAVLDISEKAKMII